VKTYRLSMMTFYILGSTSASAADTSVINDETSILRATLLTRSAESGLGKASMRSTLLPSKSFEK
jgi:hypothetical protein